MVDAVLGDLDGELAAMYPQRGRPSVPPEMLLKSSVLMALYSIRSERAFCERLNYDMLFKWFLGLRIDERSFDASTFSKNRQRLLDHDIADRFFAAVVEAAKLRRYCSSGHFSVDGTLLEAWASHKSFKPKGAQAEPAEPAAAGGRNQETDWRGTRRRTVGGDRNYDTKDFVADARAAGFTPHVAQNTTRRRSAIDGRTTRHAGYTISQRTRKRVEEPFGWIKTIAGGRKLRHRGRQRNRAWFLIAAASYNLVRIAQLDTPTT